jgi:hypothetical protein
MSYWKPIRYTAYSLVLIIITGCTLARKHPTTHKVGRAEEISIKDTGDAYLFDLKIYRQGKKNSVRLDIYRNAEKLGFFARGYLGKGVMKGVLTSDSILVYFPTEKEYYSGPINGLIPGNCMDNFRFDMFILDLFRQTPDKLEYALDNFYLTVLEEKSKKKKYRFESRICPEQFEMEYDFKNSRFIPKKIRFDKIDGSFKLIGERRKFRTDIDLPDDKFTVEIPDNAFRIHP